MIHEDLDFLLDLLSIPKRIRELKSLHKVAILKIDRKLKQRESCINQMQEAMELGEKVYPYEVLVLLGEIEDKELKSE